MTDAPDESPEGTNPGTLPRTARVLVRVLLVLLALEAAYLVAGNAFLRMDWGQALISKEEKRRISWNDAWTPLPGVVRVEGFEIRARTAKVTWRLAVDEAWLWMAPLELLVKRFHVRWIRAAGAESQVRFHARDAAGQPTVEGFADLPPPEPKDRKARPWRLAFDDVEVRRVGEVWIGPARHRPVEGSAQEGVARGELVVVVKRSVELPRLEVELTPGRTSLGEGVHARSTRLSFDGRVDAFDPSEVKGADRLEFITGDLALETEEGSLGLLEHYFRGLPAAIEADAQLTASLHVRRGILRAPSRLEVAEGTVRGRYLGWRAEGEGTVRGEVAADGSATLLARLEKAELRRGESPLLDARDVTFEARSQRADLTESRPSMEVRAELPPTEVEDLGVFDRYLPKEGPIRLSGGRGTLRASGRLATTPAAEGSTAGGTTAGGTDAEGTDAEGTDAEGPEIDVRFDGDLLLQAEEVRGRVRGQEMRADLRLEVKVPWLDAGGRTVGIDGSRLELRRVSGGGIRDWWAEAEVLHGRARSGENWGVRGEVRAKIADTGPLLALVTGRHPSLSLLDRLLTVRDLEMEAQVRSDAQSAELRDAVIRGPGSSRVLGELRFADGGYEMLLHASWDPFALSLYQGHQEIEVDLRHSLEWFERRKESFWE